MHTSDTGLCLAKARLNHLEQRIDRVQVTYRNQVAHLIRVASRRIDQAEPVRKQVIRLLSRIEKAISPQTKNQPPEKPVRRVRPAIARSHHL